MVRRNANPGRSCSSVTATRATSRTAPTDPLLHDRVGVAVLVFDYRGYGKSEGTPNEAGVLADALAARAWLAERAGVAERIVLMGESLGGAVAVDLAADGRGR